jgi:hypothetical protein
MSSVTQMSEQLSSILGDRACHLARETGFIKRERAFNGADFAQSLLFGWLQCPELTMDGLSQVLGRRQVRISAAGLSQRFSKEAATFMERVLCELTAVQMRAEADVEVGLLNRFAAVFLEDTSSIVLPSELTSVWGGCGSGTSSVKLAVRWEVKSGQLQGPSLMHGRRHDQNSPFGFDQLPVGSLFLGDLGYFHLGRFAQWHATVKQRRYFLSRYRCGTWLGDRRGQELDLEQILPQVVGERKELFALLGKSQRLPVRLLLERVPTEVAEQRRERVRQMAKDHGREPDAGTLWFCDWTVLVSNIPRRLLSFDEAHVLLRLRWQIERLFRLWKQEGLIDEWNSKKPWRILCELYAKLAAMVIQHWLIVAGTWQDPHRSLVKAAQTVQREAGSLMAAITDGRLPVVIQRTLDCMQSGCRIGKRKAQPSTAQLLEGAPLPPKRPAPKTRYRHAALLHRWPAGKGWAYQGYQHLRARQTPLT